MFIRRKKELAFQPKRPWYNTDEKDYHCCFYCVNFVQYGNTNKGFCCYFFREKWKKTRADKYCFVYK